MRAHKRSWLYGGLAHPVGVVMAQRRPALVRKRLPPGSRLLLAGDDHAWGLGPFFAELCRDAGVRLHQDLDSAATVESWARSGRLGTAVQKWRPQMVILSLSAAKADERLGQDVATLAAEGRGHGATLVWVRPPTGAHPERPLWDHQKVPSFHSEALALPRGVDGQPSARGYAGWAGALWRWIG